MTGNGPRPKRGVANFVDALEPVIGDALVTISAAELFGIGGRQ